MTARGFTLFDTMIGRCALAWGEYRKDLDREYDLPAQWGIRLIHVSRP